MHTGGRLKYLFYIVFLRLRHLRESAKSCVHPSVRFFIRGNGQFPLDNPLGHFTLPCSVRVRVRVRFMVWVRGEMSGRGMSKGKCPTLLSSGHILLPRYLTNTFDKTDR